jgi:hypothetical protein
VWLDSRRVQEPTRATYAAGLQRFLKFGEDALGVGSEELLPRARGAVPDEKAVVWFISWAASRYKISTIRSTISSLCDWCREKGAPTETVNNRRTKTLLNTVEREQGPLGLPAGKQGMPGPVLKALLGYLGRKAQEDPHMGPIHHRDICWLILGF